MPTATSFGLSSAPGAMATHVGVPDTEALHSCVPLASSQTCTAPSLDAVTAWSKVLAHVTAHTGALCCGKAVICTHRKQVKSLRFNHSKQLKSLRFNPRSKGAACMSLNTLHIDGAVIEQRLMPCDVTA